MGNSELSFEHSKDGKSWKPYKQGRNVLRFFRANTVRPSRKKKGTVVLEF